MSEFMGLVRGVYEAKTAEGFAPGGASLHCCMTPHGPDTETFERAISVDNEAPSHLPPDTLAFMFEFNMVPRLTATALGAPTIDRDYYQCWIGLKSHFDPGWTSEGAKESRSHAIGPTGVDSTASVVMTVGTEGSASVGLSGGTRGTSGSGLSGSGRSSSASGSGPSGPSGSGLSGSGSGSSASGSEGEGRPAPAPTPRPAHNDVKEPAGGEGSMASGCWSVVNREPAATPSDGNGAAAAPTEHATVG